MLIKLEKSTLILFFRLKRENNNLRVQGEITFPG